MGPGEGSGCRPLPQLPLASQTPERSSSVEVFVI